MEMNTTLSAIQKNCQGSLPWVGRWEFLGGKQQFAQQNHPLKKTWQKATGRPLPVFGTFWGQRVPVGISWKGMFLSTRGSWGKPSTRSAMMFFKISSEPPAMR